MRMKARRKMKSSCNIHVIVDGFGVWMCASSQNMNLLGVFIVGFNWDQSTCSSVGFMKTERVVWLASHRRRHQSQAICFNVIITCRIYTWNSQAGMNNHCEWDELVT